MNRFLHDLHTHDYAQNLDTSINLGSVLTCNFNSNGQILFVGTLLGEVFMFDTNTKYPLARFPTVGASIVSVSSTLDQNWLISTTTTGLITRYHIPSLTIDVQLRYPTPIQWSQVCPSNKDIVIITPVSPIPTCIINIALEREQYQQTFDFNSPPKAFELSTWLNSIPSRSNLSFIPWLIDPRFKLPAEHPLRQASPTLQKLETVPPSILPKNVPFIPQSSLSDSSSAANLSGDQPNTPSGMELEDTTTTTPMTTAAKKAAAKKKTASSKFVSKLQLEPSHITHETDDPITGTRSILHSTSTPALLTALNTKFDFITFASFSPMGDKIALGGNRGHSYVADVFFAPTVFRPDNDDYLNMKDGYIPGLPTIVEKHINLPRQSLYHDPISSSHNSDTISSTTPTTPTNNFLDPTTPTIENSLTHLLNNKVFTFPNGIIITNITPLLPPKSIPRTTICQMQFSNFQPTFTQTPLEYFLVVCYEDGHCITYNVQTGIFVSLHRNIAKRNGVKKAVFSPSNSHVYIMYVGEEHEITIKPIETTGATSQLHGPHESCYDICAHPYLPIIVTVPATGRLIFWSTRSRESWTAYNPIFQELEENLEYVEIENDFDLNILPTHQGDVRKLYTTDYQTNNIVPFNTPPPQHPAIVMFHYAPLNHYDAIVQHGVHQSKAFQLEFAQQLQRFNSLSVSPLHSSPTPTSTPTSTSTSMSMTMSMNDSINSQHNLPTPLSLRHLLLQSAQPSFIPDPPSHQPQPVPSLNTIPSSSLAQPLQPTLFSSSSTPSASTVFQLHSSIITENPMLHRPQIHTKFHIDPFLVNLVAANVTHKLAKEIDIDDLRHQFLTQVLADPTITVDRVELRSTQGFLLPPFVRLYYLRKALTNEEQNTFLCNTLNEPHLDPLLLCTSQYLQEQGTQQSIDHVIVKNNISSGMGAAISAELGMNNFNRLDSQTTFGRGAGPDQLSNPIYTLYHASVKRTLAQHYPHVHGPGLFRDD